VDSCEAKKIADGNKLRTDKAPHASVDTGDSHPYTTASVRWRKLDRTLESDSLAMLT